MEKDNKRRKIFLNCLKSILIILIFSKLVPQVLTEDPIYSYVMMKLPKGNALKFYNRGIPGPNEIHINGNIENVRSPYVFDFTKEENNVTLIWKNSITDCGGMFKDCEYILEMDFTHFYTSHATKMADMFLNCKRLKSLDLSNFDTSKVSYPMHNMFWNCYEL